MIEFKDAIVGLRAIDDSSIDIVLADPPYNIGKNFDIWHDNLPMDKYLEWSDAWIKESVRVLKDTGTLYIYGYPEILAHISVRMPLDHKWLVWHYTNKAVPSLNFWQRSHESILCCWKKNRIFNRDTVREPYTDTFLANAAGKTRKGTKGRYNHDGKETIYTAHEDGALPRDVIKVAALAGGAGAAERWFLCKDCDRAYPNKQLEDHYDHKIVQHPTQKPYELTRRLLMAAKPANGIVCIPFVGSGSECAVAADIGMDFIGFEINKEYIALAQSFLEHRAANLSEKKDV